MAIPWYVCYTISSLTIWRNPTKFGVWVTWKGVQQLWPHPLGPWGWVKRSNIIKFQSQSKFQRILYQTLCVLLQIKDMKHIEQVFVLMPGSCLRGGTWGRWGCTGVKTLFFLTWPCGISNWQGWWVEDNASKNFTLGQTGDLGVKSKGVISITKSISKIFIPNIVCVLTNKIYKTYGGKFSFLGLCRDPGVGLEEVKNLSVGICDGASSTAHSSFDFLCF